MPKQRAQRNAASYAADLHTKDKLLSSIHKISSLLTRPISLDTILTSIVQETALVFGFMRLAIFLVDNDRKLLECRYIHGFNPHDSERALRFPYRLESHDCVETRVAKYGKTIFVKDYLNDPRITPVDLKVSRIMRRVSTIAVPLKIKKDIIGLITADKDESGLSLTKKDIDTLSTFANQASIIIENARLQEQNQKKIKQLLTLQEISKKTSSTFHLEKLFQVISASALKLTKATSSALLLLDDEGKHLTIASAKGFEPADKELFRLKVGVGIIGWVAQTGTPALVNDVRNDPRYREIIEGVVSQLSVPLMNDKRVAGVLHVASHVRAAFSEDDQKLLLIFSGHTASLIKNVRLYGQVMTERNFRENILESSPNSVVTINLKKEISSINKRTEEMFHLRRKNVLGAQSSTVFEDDITRIVDLALEHHAVVDNKEIQRVRTDGSLALLGITSSLLRNHQGNLIGAMIILRDLTEEKKTEELIRRIDRLTSLGQLSAGIAHEIRNPLASINFNVQLLAKKADLPETALNLIKDTQEGIDRIRNLVKGMLDFAKPSRPCLKRYALIRVVRESITLMDSQLKEKKVEVLCALQDNLPEVILDAHQIQQVLVNLLLNGMEAMPEGGTIRISGQWEKKGPRKRCEQIVLQVADQGTGISRDDLPRIFNPFFTTKPEGTGLGLSIVHKILEQHSASVDVFSDKNRGTTFTLRFPIHSDEEKRCTDIRS
ncbi:GAF domain-containing protein [uncultured Desulfobulbus sp.]|uniref:GAF domain-containing protein n=1 Tax=uncultured Desulfobulbus sp. TaxID=239745 RepID=UPI0029C6E4C3|nr:GAF domain-containing protein [uncultured Desulfobulbus sp.]